MRASSSSSSGRTEAYRPPLPPTARLLPPSLRRGGTDGVPPLPEFKAHEAPVNALALGTKSGRVYASGGDDNVVNVWAVGSSQSIMTLRGHSSPVEAVAFDANEEVVVAGALSGTLKLWDLESQRLARTLVGHKANCKAVAFHPYGDIFASGSQDTNVKIWDVRRKNCIQTYKDHSQMVGVVKFSPDGRWVISGSADATIKVWDLTAGKLFHEFAAHSGAITSLDFHPKEFVLASGSADRTVKFWDLDAMTLESSSAPEATAVRCIKFHPSGEALLSASHDSLKVIDFELLEADGSASVLDVVWVAWPKLADFGLTAATQLVGYHFHHKVIGGWLINLDNLRPFRDIPELLASAAEPVAKGKGKGKGKGKAKSKDKAKAKATARAHALAHASAPTPATAPLDVSTLYPAAAEAGAGAGAGAGAASSGGGPRRVPRSPRAARQARVPSAHLSSPSAGFPAPAGPGATLSAASAHASPGGGIPSSFSAPLGLDPAAFVHAPSGVRAGRGAGAGTALGPLLESGPPMQAVLSSRLHSLKLVRALLADGRATAAVEKLVALNDAAVLVDVLATLNGKPNFYSLSHCVALLPPLNELLASALDRHVAVALQTIHILIESFGPLLVTHTQSPVDDIGVDISKDERRQKCAYCLSAFATMVPTVAALTARDGDIAARAHTLLLSFDEYIPQ
ncbi:katanin p80 WD40-containing subunit B1 [Thecamonas trahens ATCC 50062]|uniref:Katanin p80 WD40 repeat-containing subunit B1 homolog n=1 Tax=Thecamonas trahens ATCC 50062 TaxID=461836 RepID=A0A0L0DRR6_THETB|nr:katanin p80 WD40-containing subunit B1 [Thecamonas trahens ATCC 50062]KNC55024.1 katanin p80 WD40-containing subunit B1 [Thecamonas trahens ATCC 50062]|eukprot:XP_013753331.1 katanin p80 WD40-containing subunit B1 [Thecamonas trahens ATCC 50062]